jgi:hypothetical protein
MTIILLSLSFIAVADPDTKQANTELESSIAKLDKISHLPVLLPAILKNRDFIGLTDDQVAELDQWRTENREPMLAAMKAIVQKRVAIREAAISPTVSSARLMQMQNEIFRLQREVLEYKLSCRDHIVNTFSIENWDSFFMLLADEGIGLSVPVGYAEK